MNGNFWNANFCGGAKGFSIVEVMVALSVLALFTATTFFTFTTLNQQAIANRLYTGALSVAQSQIDSIQNLATGQMIGSNAPPITAGSITWPSTVNTSATATSIVTIYSDPQVIVNNAIPPTVTGTLSTAVWLSGTLGVSNTSWNYYGIRVDVLYTYRNNPYDVVMQTLRSNAP